MLKPFFSLMAIIIILCMPFSNSHAGEINENAGTSAGQILKISVGARAASMGESYVAAADDVYAGYWNPAGLIYVGTSQIGFMHNEWFEDIRHEFLGYVQPIGDFGTISGSIAYISMGELEKTDETGNSNGTFHPYNILLSLSFGKRLNGSIALGFTSKFLQENIDVESAQAFAFDIGGLYFLPGTKLVLGVNIQNLGTEMKFVEESFPLPRNIKVGAAYKMLDNALTIVTDVNKPRDGNLNLGLGIEYKIMGIVNLRTGYKYNISGNDLGSLSGLRTGIGIDIRDYNLDYAFAPYGELGQAHRISLVASF